eukprot:scaffold166473_cov36-Cyclotella_meneghiniana.AAC.1
MTQNHAMHVQAWFLRGSHPACSNGRGRGCSGCVARRSLSMHGVQGEAGCKENSRAERSREIINGGTVREAHNGPHGVQ